MDKRGSSSRTLSSVCDNSFLDECDKLEDITEVDRFEIERKFQLSAVNSTYVFPRTTQALNMPKRGCRILPLRSPVKVHIRKALPSGLRSMKRKPTPVKVVSQSHLPKMKPDIIKHSRFLSDTLNPTPKFAASPYNPSGTRMKKTLLSRVKKIAFPSLGF